MDRLRIWTGEKEEAEHVGNPYLFGIIPRSSIIGGRKHQQQFRP